MSDVANAAPQDDTAGADDSTQSSDAPAKDDAPVITDADVAAQASDTGDDAPKDTAPDDKSADAGSGDASDEGDDAPKGDGDDDVTSEGAPDEYGDFDLPEGMELDEKTLGVALPFFKEEGMSQVEAQKLVGLYADLVKAQGSDRIDAWQSTQEDWKQGIINHDTLGKGKLNDSLDQIAVLIDTVFPDEEKNLEFRSMLTQTGIGNNPLMFELLATVGQSFGEDGQVQTGLGPAPTRDRTDILYPDDKKGADDD